MKRKDLEKIIKQELVLEKNRKTIRPTSWWLKQGAVRHPGAPDVAEEPALAPSVDLESIFPNIYDMSLGRDQGFINSRAGRSEIFELQRALVALGYDIGTSGESRDGVDGQWGRKTKDAVEDFQEEMIPLYPDLFTEDDIDGIVGEKTAEMLMNALRDIPAITFAPPPKDELEISPDISVNLGRVMDPEEVPLEKVGDQEPFRMDTSDEPDDWDDSVAEDWDELQARTKGFISAMPATIASMGHAEDESDAKDQASSIIGSTYRSPMEQARAVYNYPYKHDLAVRKQDPTLQPGDYYKSRQADRAGRLEAMRQALVDLGMSGDTNGVYANTSSSPYIQVFDEWETLTGGDLDNHATNRDRAYEILYDKIKDTYASGHGDGRAIDIPLFTGVGGILDKAGQIAGVNYDAHRETDHWHIDISEGNKQMKNKKMKKAMTLLERNIQAFLIESDPDNDKPQFDDEYDEEGPYDTEAEAADYDMSAQLQDVMNDEELEAYGAGYDASGNPLDEDPRDNLADSFNNAVANAREAKMDIKNIVDVFAEIFMTTQGYEEQEVLDAFSSFVHSHDINNPRPGMSERRLFEASRGRWQKLSGLLK